MLLPDSAGSAAHPHLIVGAGKEGKIYLVDRDNMGHYNSANDNQIVQEVPGAIGSAFSSPAYFNHQIYYQGSSDVTKGFLITNGVIVATPVSQATTSFSALGGTPSVSANGTNNGIVWTLQSDAFASSGPAVLHAYNATNLAHGTLQQQPESGPGQSRRRDSNDHAHRGQRQGFCRGAIRAFHFRQQPFPGHARHHAGRRACSPIQITVTLSDATPDSTIYYTLDGTTPTTNSPVYTGPFVLAASTGVHAIAAQPGAANSGVASAGFVDSSAIGTGTGLLGSYWSNVSSVDFTNASFALPATLVRTDAAINFNWAATPPDPAIGLTNFAVRWTGSIQPQYNETYTFSTETDSGARLFVNGAVADQQMGQPAGHGLEQLHRPPGPAAIQYRNGFFQPVGRRAGPTFLEQPFHAARRSSRKPSFIRYTNPPPAVVLSAPANGSAFTAAASVSLSAEADAPYNPLSYVSFYTNGVLVGAVSNAPYALTVTGLPAGSYTLTATATDGSGLTGTSAPVNITVAAASGLPYGLTTNGTLGHS